MKLYNGDCLEIMDELIKDGVKVDAIITDPPYGTTACKWDSVIDFDDMWERLKLLRNDNTPIVLFGSEPFSSALRMSNIKEFKYDWIWEKKSVTGFANAKKQPLRNIENISVFYKKWGCYNPQGLIEINKVNKNGSTVGGGIMRGEMTDEGRGSLRTSGKSYVQTHTNYPKQVLQYNREVGKTVHPTQKPIELLEYLIKTYTNENDTVLDFTMGSGSTGVACMNLDRHFIGIELDKDYFDIAKDRMSQGRLPI